MAFHTAIGTNPRALRSAGKAEQKSRPALLVRGRSAIASCEEVRLNRATKRWIYVGGMEDKSAMREDALFPEPRRCAPGIA